MTYPWEVSTYKTAQRQREELPNLPPDLVRDKDNIAPYMRKKTKCTLCATVESPGFYTGCMYLAGEDCGEWKCDGHGNLTGGLLSLSKVPPASPPSWVPPWGSKT